LDIDETLEKTNSVVNDLFTKKKVFV